MRAGVAIAGSVDLMDHEPDVQAADVTIRPSRVATLTPARKPPRSSAGYDPVTSHGGQVLHPTIEPGMETKNRIGDAVIPFWEEDLPSAKNKLDAGTRTIDLQLPEALPSSDEIRIHISYRGRIQDAPTASPGLRFVRPDRTLGYIGAEGIYLTSETSWYPEIPGSLATFRVTAVVPAGWRAVTHGQEVLFTEEETTATSEWNVARPDQARRWRPTIRETGRPRWN